MTSKDVTIGVISNPGDPQLGTVLNGILEVVQQQGGKIITIGAPLARIGVPPPATAHIDGWIVVHWPDGLAEFAASGVPLVTVNVASDSFNCPAVMPDNRSGVYTLITHLIALGHTRIAFMGSMLHTDVHERYAGYVAALADHNIALDPTLVFDIDASDEGDSVRAAFHALADGGLRCSAIFPCHDYNAQRVIAEAQRCGYRVPDDLAVVGFDDIDTAQFFSPPITTVRQQFVEHGRVAARLLLGLLAGEAVPPETVLVPTAMIVRRSCGTQVVALPKLPDIVQLLQRDDWQEQLPRALVSVLYDPLPLDPQLDPEIAWPGVRMLPQILVAVCNNGDLPAANMFDSLWRAAVTRGYTLSNLFSAIDLLADVGRALANATNNPDVIAHMRLFIRQLRPKLFWHYQAQSSAGVGSGTIHVAEVYQWAVTNLLNSAQGHAEKLSWVDQTNDLWACFARWDGDPAGADAALTVVGVYAPHAEPRPVLGTRYTRSTFPPLDFLPPADGRTDLLVKLLPVRSASRYWGLLALYGPIEPHIYSPPLAQVLANVLDREGLLSQLLAQQETLQIAYDRERILAETVRELGSPIIPLFRDVLLVPLVGAIDRARSQQIIERVLEAVSAYQAEIVLLDLTGVPLVDTQVASALVQTAQAATMLGAQVYLVGIRAEIAQSIVNLGIHLSGLRTFATLANAISSLQSTVPAAGTSASFFQ